MVRSNDPAEGRLSQIPGGAGVAHTFAVADVAPATQPLTVMPYDQAVSEFLGGDVEACSQYRGQLLGGVVMHPLVEALHRAFADHRPLALSPDIIWLTLTQGLALHINANAERLRHHFVQHEGQLKIVVERHEFIKGSPENDWPGVFGEFSTVIREHIGDETHELIVADFSTTGPVERAASEIALLDAMQAFFSYEVQTRCGIPSITLEGTADDWASIARRVKEFARFDLEWWVEALDPLLNQFVEAASGNVDRRFWDSIYKWHGAEESGRWPFVSGWILNFFPYLNPVSDSYFVEKPTDARTHRRNSWIGAPRAEDDGPGPDQFPRLPARAPFVWQYHGTRFNMEFIGGLIGIRQDPQSLCLRPEIGWAVWETGAEDRKMLAEAEAGRQREQTRAEASRRASAIKNADPKHRFSEARELGLLVHELYREARPADASRDNADEGEEKRLLLELAMQEYEANPVFRDLWEKVHGQPPAPFDKKWLWLWKRV